jgi:O-phospho-L-seryl-tRNASec:L-selenocysteinyl-tRNA synthase
MTISLVLLALTSYRPHCKVVIWLRIDQKTCLKSIYTAGCTAHVVSNKMEGDDVATDLDAVSAAIAQIGAENVLAVISTTSCFAPRRPDDVKGVARLCKHAQIPHVVNHAYGLQDAHANKLLCSAGALTPYPDACSNTADGKR